MKQKEPEKNHNYIIDKFQKECKDDVHLYVCVICHRQLFFQGVKPFHTKNYNQDLVTNCATDTYVHSCDDKCQIKCAILNSPKGKGWICHTCHSHLRKENMPSQAVANNLNLETIPDVLNDMNALEKQLIALRLPFMKIGVLPQGGQKGIKGPIIMVNADIEKTRSTLPRPLTQESQIVPVKLKRKLEFKGHVSYEVIDTVKVENALAYLKESNTLYSDVQVDNKWSDSTDDTHLTEHLLNVQDEDTENVLEKNEPEAQVRVCSEAITSKPCVSLDDLIPENPECDVDLNEHDHMRGVQHDSCLQPPDLRTEALAQVSDKIYAVAPAEGNPPVSIFQEDMGEAKAFPALFPTGKNTFNEAPAKKLTHSQYFNSRLLNADTRFANDSQYIFFAQYCVELNQLLSSISFAMRKGHSYKNNGEKITAKMLTDKEEVHKFLKADDAFAYMNALWGSPEYWTKTLNDLFAMIRQIGIPTWFCTFSCAELSRWPEVIETIELQHGRVVDFWSLDWPEKCAIIRSNPVTAVRMFHERVSNFMKNVIKSEAYPIGEVIDHFYRVEFQQRGAPHIHCLFWVKNAPKLNENSDEEIAEFVDKYVSTELPDADDEPELHEIVSTCQMHRKRHTKSCKKGNQKCRYNFPRPASENTFIARAKNKDDGNIDDMSDDNQHAHQNARKCLKSMQDAIQKNDNPDASRDDMRREAGFDSHESFQTAMNLVSQKDSIVLKRDVHDTWVNSYNPTLLRAWNANIDIQYVLDPYSCIMYIVSYISKSEKELGEILRVAKEELQENNIDLHTQMKKLGTVYIENREVSVQESVIRTCGLPLKDCSRKIPFLSSDKNSTRMSKSIAEIERAAKANGDDEDVWMTSPLDKYRARPKNPEFDKVCHASFA